MAREEEMGQELIKNFDFLDGKIRVPRERRIFIDDVPVNKFEEVLEFLKNKIYFNMLCTITGLDDGNTLGIIYHLANKEGIVINIKIRVPKDKPKIKTIIEYFPSAEFYERELVDLFGIEVEGLPEGTRYPLPDDWPDGQYPLRKDWKPDVLKKESE